MRPTTRLRIQTAAILASALALAACDGKVHQCNRLIAVINAEQAALEDVTGNDAAALEKLAGSLDGVAEKVGKVEIKDQRLKGFQGDYQAIARDLAKATRTTADAVKTGDPAKANTAAQAMKAFRPREDGLVEGLNGYCAGKGGS